MEKMSRMRRAVTLISYVISGCPGLKGSNIQLVVVWMLEYLKCPPRDFIWPGNTYAPSISILNIFLSFWINKSFARIHVFASLNDTIYHNLFSLFSSLPADPQDSSCPVIYSHGHLLNVRWSVLVFACK